MTEFVVSNVGLAEDGIELAFMRLPDDIRSEGKLIATRTLSIANNHPAYQVQIEELRELIVDLATDAFQDFESHPIVGTEVDDDDDDDDEEGMGQ